MIPAQQHGEPLMAEPRARGEALWFAALLAVQVVAVWTCARFPSHDGPAHVYNARILLRYWSEGGEYLREYFTLDLAPYPNWLAHALLAGLQVLASPVVAEKLLVTLYALGLPLSARFALNRLFPGSGWLALLCMPLVFSWPLHMGFYGFCLGLALYFLGLGLAQGVLLRPGRGALLGFAAFQVLAYFAHPVTLVMTWGSLPFLWLARVLARDAGRPRPRFYPSLLASLPALGLLLWFVAHQALAGEALHGAAQHSGFDLRPWKLGALLSLRTLVSFDPREVWLAQGAAALLGLAACTRLPGRVRRAGREPGDAWALWMLACALVYWFAPSALAGGGYLYQRLAVFPFFALILWLGSQPWSRPERWALAAAGGVLVLGGALVRHERYRVIDGYLAEMDSAVACLAPGESVLPVLLDLRGEGARPPVSTRVSPFVYQASRTAAERDLVNLGDYQGSLGYFPTRWRSEREPMRHMRFLNVIDEEERRALEPDFLDYALRTGGRIDAVLVWYDPADPSDARALAAIEERMRPAFELDFVSRPLGWARLYRAR